MMEPHSVHLWLGLFVTLYLSTFGIPGLFYLPLYILLIVSGCCFVVWKKGQCTMKQSECHFTSPDHLRPFSNINIQELIESCRQPERKFKADKRFTGSSVIDETLQEVLQYAIRDYVHQWYYDISDHQEFIYTLGETIQKVVIAMSSRAKECNWVSFLTTVLVDDFATHIRLFRSAQQSRNNSQNLDDYETYRENLEAAFFDAEAEMEGVACRDHICQSQERENDYLREISEIILFHLLPQEDFRNKSFRYIMREVMVFGVFKPSIELITDPDYVNQTIVWFCKDTTFTNEAFLQIVKSSDDVTEIEAVAERVEQEMARLRSQDTNIEDQDVLKQQIGSLGFVLRVCQDRIRHLHGEDVEIIVAEEAGLSCGPLIYQLPLEVVLVNNVALSYFTDYMATAPGGQGLLFFWLTVEGYRVSTEQQLQEIRLQCLAGKMTSASKKDLEMMRAAAQCIYDEYLSPDADPRVSYLDETLVKQIELRIASEKPTDAWFDDAQKQVLSIMNGERYYPAFKRSALYMKCLADLDLLKVTEIETAMKNSKHCNNNVNSSSNRGGQQSVKTSALSPEERPLLLAAIIRTENKADISGRSYAVYAISVSRATDDAWLVERRYSEFHDLHILLKERFGIGSLELPCKRTFNTMEKSFVERRRKALHQYLQYLLDPHTLTNYRGLYQVMTKFLETGSYEKEKGSLARKVDNLLNPLRTSVQSVSSAVRSFPDHAFDGVQKVSDGFKYILSTSGNKLLPDQKQPYEKCKVGNLLAQDDDDNIPLRIMILLLGEVFDLRHRDRWLRRQFVGLLRQIIKTTFGDTINRKIVSHVDWMTSADQVTEYVRQFRDSFWPGGVLAEQRDSRDSNTKLRTKVATKVMMFGSMPDELKTVIGAETTKFGILRVFEMFQYETLNKRLLYVILEALLKVLLPDCRVEDILAKFHAKSNRVKTNRSTSSSTTTSTSRSSSGPIRM